MSALERQQASEIALLKRQIAEIRQFLGMDEAELAHMEYLEAIKSGDKNLINKQIPKMHLWMDKKETRRCATPVRNHGAVLSPATE